MVILKTMIYGRIKGFLHNVCIDAFFLSSYLIITCIIIAMITETTLNANFILITCIPLFTSIIFVPLGYFRYVKKTNTHLKFFRCTRSIICKDKIWINMHVKKEKDKAKQDKNRRWEFMKEMEGILRNIPDGCTVYCTTHDKIVKQILRKYPDAEVTRAYKKDMRSIERKLLSKEERKLQKENVAQFYAVKFTK